MFNELAQFSSSSSFYKDISFQNELFITKLQVFIPILTPACNQGIFSTRRVEFFLLW